ncbi:MAG: twin-arginine translocation signal domain-containing protein, partial [Rhodobacteraceae bacterium]|nr:twin-arginine translocation signal domain-containing protein [Paracoccaceae bacterium]
MNRRSFLKTTAATAVVAGAGLPAFAADEPLKIGFIYVGPVGDMGWSYQHDQGRKAIEEKYGDKVQTSFIESVPEGPDAERA